MEFSTISIDPRITQINHNIENMANTTVRSYDRLMAKLGLGGRKGYYDDEHYEFEGGDQHTLRTKHYDKSMRLLWKAEEHVAWSSFRDCTKDEELLLSMANQAMTKSERTMRAKLAKADFAAQLDAHYTPRQKQAIVNILSLIGHGEAYAWLVSTELLNEVRSTGGRTALTMQVLEEAKHFVVLRELIQAFNCPIPRLNAWEYMLMERIYKSDGLEKFFGMNVVVEGFALSLFGMLSQMPGLEILRLFHRDESRHTALPGNYLKEFPLSWWQKNSPVSRTRRLVTVLSALPVLIHVEDDLAVLGIDAFDLGGSLGRKILKLADRVGFKLPMSSEQAGNVLNAVFNTYCKATRDDFTTRNFLLSETTMGEEERELEKEVFMMGG